MIPDVSGTITLIVSWVLALTFLGYVVITVNWAAFSRHSGVQHFFLGGIIIVSGFWFMRAGIRPGLDFHIIGVTALTLLMGWRIAVLVLSVVLAVMVVLGVVDLKAWAISLLLGVVVPVAATYQLFIHVYRRLPHNPFIYILVAGFLNAGLSQVVYTSAVSAWYWWAEGYTLDYIWGDYLRLLPLMMFPEGIINGMFIAGMVSFHPRWLSTFDEDSYFN